MAAQAHHKIKVQVVPTPPFPETDNVTCTLYGRKSHREYVISMTDSEGNKLLSNVQFRFSELHRRFASSFPLKFPQRGWVWEDYTSDETNVRLRTDELKSYFHSLVNQQPQHLVSTSLYHVLGVEPSTCPALQAIGQKMVDEQLGAKEAAEKRRRLKKQKQREQERKAWELAQSLDVRRPETRKSLRYPSQRSFVFSSRLFSFGSADIYGGPDGNSVWFRLERTDLTLNPFADLTYYLTTVRGVPMLKMVEHFRMADYLCELFYVTGPDTTVFAARVHRPFQFALMGEQYDIECPGRERITCDGGWLDCDFRVNGKRAAEVSQHWVSFTDSHTLTVGAGQDSLLMVGICCAIGRIHAEIARHRN